jgi:hypothetical protein
MKVSGVGSSSKTGQTSRTSKASSTGTGSFVDNLSQASESTVSETKAAILDSVSQVSTIESLLTIQEVGDSLDSEGKKRWVRYGEDVLDQLEELRHGLLLGTVPKEKLSNLAKMVRSKRDYIADPRLSALLDDIELRAEVELAKLEMRQG